MYTHMLPVPLYVLHSTQVKNRLKDFRIIYSLYDSNFTTSLCTQSTVDFIHTVAYPQEFI